MGNTSDSVVGSLPPEGGSKGEPTSSIGPGRPPHVQKRATTSSSGTDDEWIVRDEALLRLTGKHPLNGEPPLSLLTKSFLTPADKSYVRNHGAVPRLTGKEHRLEILGLGLVSEKPLSFTMDQIREFPRASVTLTIACSGTRRREVNAVRPSIGVPFSPASVMTATYEGVYVSTLLRVCGLAVDASSTQSMEDKPRFVNFAGPKTELPRGEYGTTLPLGHVMNPANEVMVAYKQNGEDLLPDHGYPLRLIIPGYIGGRMVKWLKRIEIADEESKSSYYYHDNRLLPSVVQQYDEAEKGKWWYKPEYIIGELNINSVITEPVHGAIVELEGAPDALELKGFAYSGGGRRVVIVELSLDDGKTWEPARFLPDGAQPNAYGMWWSWRLWTIQVSMERLLNGGTVIVRAWDTSFNTQPESIAWNLLGMMNNSRYMVSIQTCRSEHGRLAITFMHPQPPNIDLVDKQHERPPCEVEERNRPQVAPSSRVGEHATYTREQVAMHRSDDDLWLIVNGKVYDVTTFLPDHPGGSGIITASGGEICQEFNDIHSEAAHDMLKDYYIGEIMGPAKEEAAATEGTQGGRDGDDVHQHEQSPRKEEAEEPSADTPFLDPHVFKSCPLVMKTVISHDTRRFRFGLPHPKQSLGLPLGQHLYLKATIHGETVMRPYTPTSLDHYDEGYFELVVKVYFANTDKRFPLGGKMTQYLDQMKVGDTIDVKGPMGHIRYQGNGSFMNRNKLVTARHVGMLAGGTGITPMFQLLKASLLDRDDSTSFSLLFANNTPDDVLLQHELDDLARDHPSRFKVWHTVSRVPVGYGEEAWPFSIGYVDKDMIAAHLPSPDAEGGTCVLLCGPPPMIQYACMPNLHALNYNQEQLIEF